MKEKKYLPMMAGFTNEQLFEEGNIEMWDKMHSLPQNTQNLLLSDGIMDFMQSVERKYYLTDEKTEEIAINVRKYFFREITKKQLIEKISILCNTSQEEALKLLRVINNINIVEEQQQIAKKKLNVKKVKIAELFQKYPKVLIQKITNQKITTNLFSEPLNPNIKNWIMVYEKELGASRHTTIDRGNFVFRSVATKGLSDAERERVAELIKAKDEEGFLLLDINKNEIVFEVEDEEEVIKKQSTPQQIPQKPVQQNVRRDFNATPQVQKTQRRSTQQPLNNQRNNIPQNQGVQNIQKPLVKNEKQLSDLEREIEKNRIEMNNFKKESTGIQTPTTKQVPQKKQQPKLVSSQKATKTNKYIKQDATQKVQNAQKVQKSGSLNGNISFSSNHKMPGEK